MMKWMIWIFAAVFMLVGCNMDQSQPLKVYSDQGVLPIQAHRGGGLRIPENTLETFLETWGMGIIPEADVRTTSDDVIICVHDKTTKRMTPGAPDSLLNTPFHDMTLAEVKSLDVGSFRGGEDQRIPTLEEVFKEMSGHPGRFIYLDYKKIDLDRLANMVHQYGLERQVIFTSKHHHLIQEWHKRIPESLSLLWIGGSLENIEKTFASIRENKFEGITTIQIHVKTADRESGLPFIPAPEYLQERLEEVNNQGILFQVLPWRMKDPGVYEQLLGLGIRSFATDYPVMTIDVYQKYLKETK